MLTLRFRKRLLKVNFDEKWTTWYEYVDLVAFIHNTSYHFPSGCKPSCLFDGQEPLKTIDLRFRSHVLEEKAFPSECLVDLQTW